MATITMTLISIPSTTEIKVRYSQPVDLFTDHTFSITGTTIALKSNEVSATKTDWSFTAAAALSQGQTLTFGTVNTPGTNTFTNLTFEIDKLTSGAYSNSFTLPTPSSFDKTKPYQIQLTITDPDTGTYQILSDPFILSAQPDTTKSMLTL